MSEAVEEIVEDIPKGIPLKDGLIVKIGGVPFEIRNGELHGGGEQTAVFALTETNQRGLYDESDFKLKYDGFGNPLHFNEQDGVKLEELDAIEARSMGVLHEWTVMDDKRRKKTVKK